MLGCWFDYAAYDGQEDSAKISQKSEDRQTTNALEELTYQVAVTMFHWVWYLRKVETGKLSHDEAAADDGHPSPNQRWRGPMGQKFSTTANVEPRGWWGSTHSGFEARQGWAALTSQGRCTSNLMCHGAFRLRSSRSTSRHLNSPQHKAACPSCSLPSHEELRRTRQSRTWHISTG